MHFVSGASARHHPRRALGDSELQSACQSQCRPCLCCAALPPPAAHESGAPVVAVPRAAGDARSLRVRKATWGDVQSVARLCAAAFVEVPGAVPAAPQVEGWAEYLESRYQESMAREVRQAVGLALTRKEDAIAKCRAGRAARRAAALQAAVASVKRRAAAGEAVTPGDVDTAAAALEASWPAGPPSEEARLRRARQWMCLVSSDAEGRIIACAVLAWCVPDAALPAPWPSGKPQRLYLSNMAVAPSWRRRGLATALLAAAERLARAWGETQVYLHVDEVNANGRKLYEAAEFTLQDEDPFWVLPPKRKLLLAKDIGRGGLGGAVEPGQ